MGLSLNPSNIMFIVYVVIMLAGLAYILWLSLRQDKQKNHANQNKEIKLQETLRQLQEKENRLKEYSVKITGLYDDIETLKKINATLKIQYKDLDEKLNNKDSELQLTKESLSSSQSQVNLDIQKTKHELEIQLKDTDDKLASAIVQLDIAKKESAKFKESCQILEKSLKEKEGVIEEELPGANETG